MNITLLFGISVALSFLAWGAFSVRYIWPWLSRTGLPEAAKPLLILHAFRFVGLVFLVPGVVSASLPPGFALPAAYGDLVAALLAWVAMFALGKPYERLALWTFNVWGALDLMFAFFQGLIGVGIAPSALGAAFFIPTVIVPLLLITHAMIFVLLLRVAPLASTGGRGKAHGNRIPGF